MNRVFLMVGLGVFGFAAASAGCGAAPPPTGSQNKIVQSAPPLTPAPASSSSAASSASADDKPAEDGDGGPGGGGEITEGGLDGAKGRGGLGTAKSAGDTGKFGESKGADTPAPPPPGQAATMSSTPLSGRLSQQEINDVLSKNAALFDECYSIGAGAGRDFHATVSVRATLGPSGAVSDAQVIQSDAKNAKVDSCVANAIRKIKFPVPKDGGTSVVTFPIEFQGAEKRR